MLFSATLQSVDCIVALQATRAPIECAITTQRPVLHKQQAGPRLPVHHAHS